jgi:hypothetical protein
MRIFRKIYLRVACWSTCSCTGTGIWSIRKVVHYYCSKLLVLLGLGALVLDCRPQMSVQQVLVQVSLSVVVGVAVSINYGGILEYQVPIR